MPQTPDFSPEDPFTQMLEVRQTGERLLGARAWFFVSCYGRVMSGPHVGRYVSGLPLSDQLELVQNLADGRVVDVHLMHLHRSGNYEASSLRWSNGELFMVFKDREQRA